MSKLLKTSAEVTLMQSLTRFGGKRRTGRISLMHFAEASAEAVRYSTKLAVQCVRCSVPVVMPQEHASQ